ncbi:VanZ family protein [Agromyces sp. MMS24-K17]|uniref:VanZ family protein n=1 Tax=Agromyces sp. MMS24-K17 TaxID=3372850 RepID=UPI0037546D5C
MTARSRSTIAVSFAVYLGLLAWLVLWKLEVPWVGTAGVRVLKLVPFVAAGGEGASDPVEVVGNLLVFVPFGLFLALLAPRWSWWRVAGVVGAASLGLEVGQYALAVGSADLTDVIANTAGGVTGAALLALARRALRTRTQAVMARACAIGTAVAVVATGVVVALPLHFAPPDVGVGLHRSGQPRMVDAPTGADPGG